MQASFSFTILRPSASQLFRSFRIEVELSLVITKDFTKNLIEIYDFMSNCQPDTYLNQCKVWYGYEQQKACHILKDWSASTKFSWN